MKSLKKISAVVMLLCALTLLLSVNAFAESNIYVPTITGTNEVTAAVYPAPDKSIFSTRWYLGSDSTGKLTLTDHENYGSSADAYIKSEVNADGSYIVYCDVTYSDRSTDNFTGTVTVTASSAPTINQITLDKLSADLSLGDGLQLSAVTDPVGYPITWSSGNDNIASVSGSGYVTAIGKGTTTVTATSGSKSAVCQITVGVPVSSVSLDRNDLELSVNQWEQLTATISPADADNKTLIWQSSDSSKVSVDANGVVRRLADGSVTITVTTEDGGKSATCNISSPEPMPTLTLSEESISLNNAARQLKVYCNGSDVTDVCEWASYNTSIATVSKGIVTPVGNGSTTVSARYSVGSCDQTLYCTVNVSKTAYALTLSTETLNLTVGGGDGYLQVRYNGNIIPANYCTWECTDSSVIGINNGTISAKKAGTASVRVKYNNEYSNICTVTVSGSSTFFTITSVSNNATFDGVNPLYFVTSEIYDPKLYPTVSVVGANNVYSRNLTYGTDYRTESSPDGHLMITLNPVTLHNLPQANFHNIAISNNGQVAYARFWRTGTSYNVYGVRTGDESNAELWGALCLISFVGAAVILTARRKDLFAK